LIAIPPNSVALRLERELLLLIFTMRFAEKATSPQEGSNWSPDSGDNVDRGNGGHLDNGLKI
jgi:hypothetical protein